MKYLLLNIISIACIISSGISQISISNVWINLDFENSADSIIIFSQDTVTMWEVGIPSKANFSSAFSPIKAIMTDTTNIYQANTNTWFEIPVIPSSYDSTTLGTCPLNICFEHQLDFDTLNSGGWIELRDNDQSWNLGQFNNGASIYGSDYEYDMLYNAENIYGPLDSLFNDSLGFPTPMLSWTHTCYSLGLNIRADRTIWDTLYFRFNFASNSSLNTSYEGWIIDDIIIGKGPEICAGAIYSNFSNSIQIFPNPTPQKINVSLPFAFNQGYYEVSDVYGGIYLISDISYEDNLFIDLNSLPSGVYFAKFVIDSNTGIKKIIKL